MFKKLGLVAVLLSASTSVVAGSISTGQLIDNYVGADGREVSTTDYTPDARYNTKWMTVERVVDDGTGDVSLNVIVNSNFVSSNNSSGFSFGDLFLMDGANYTQAADCNDGTGRVGCNEYTEKTTRGRTRNLERSTNMWEYAFDLGGDRGSSYADDVEKVGDFRELDTSSREANLDDIHSTSDNRGWQAIMVNDTTSLSKGTWSTDVSENLLKMSFDISNTSLATAEQIALRWAMTCANDIIEVVANFTNSTTRVSEPGTIALLISALAFLRLRRKA